MQQEGFGLAVAFDHRRWPLPGSVSGRHIPGEGGVMVTKPSHGWYFKLNGQTFGPFSAGQLQELLTAGRLQPRHVVWNQREQRLIFVYAATAVGDTTGKSGW